jgi:transcriptional regulator with XRE-family HTH domain
MSLNTDTLQLRRWREERHWSQEHLAEMAGIGLRTLQRIESGEQASGETLKALAAAYNVDVVALYVDAEAEAAEMIRRKDKKINAGIQLSFGIHLAGYILGMVIFIGINMGLGAPVMRWAMIWWTVGLVSHAATVAIIWLVTHYRADL